MSSVNLMAQKTGHLLKRRFWALPDINKRHEHLSQILNDSGVFGESLAPHPGVASSPSLGTVFFFEPRRREKLAVGRGGPGVEDSGGTIMTLSEPALVEKAGGQNPLQGNLAAHLSGRECQG